MRTVDLTSEIGLLVAQLIVHAINEPFAVPSLPIGSDTVSDIRNIGYVHV